MLNYKFSMKEKRAEILIYDDIGASFFGDGVTAKRVKKDLDAAGDVMGIDIRINSFGGDVFEGFTIYNIFKNHKAEKTVHIDGLAASSAATIAMAGNIIIMAQNSELMIHNALTGIYGYAKELRKTADLLDQVSTQARDVYADRSGLPPEEVQAMMDEETWMTAEVAKEKGFANEISKNLAVAAWDVDRYIEQAAKKGIAFKNAPVERLKKLPEAAPVVDVAPKAKELSYHDRIALARQEARKGL